MKNTETKLTIAARALRLARDRRAEVTSMDDPLALQLDSECEQAYDAWAAAVASHR